ncbi:alpha/beta hydrolase fold [Thermomonospora echinospora]|uniref:Alpha/beta hydrolase fold n=1 Tax=Thermomonospora echinospora TaxID=1992 RepID=A0A1H6BP16_9ACTN|nr:alpha/beta hydrolase [Thermomonospora echinospora]SEG62448.1 alpha/beta hydrolase fold [Thermomonospora echinospora]
MLRNPPSRKTAGLLACVALGGGLIAAPGTAHALAPAVHWKPCPANDPVEGAALKGLECASISVPLDYSRPDGRRITVPLTRAKHTGTPYRGVMLLNRGGPGAHGRDLPALFSRALPKELAASYDWIGFDPRGVGAAKPALVCDTSYLNPGRARPDSVPRTRADEVAWTQRAKKFADDCARKYRDVLPFMGTTNWVRDLESIRVALGRKKINYFGFSYGSYLGAAYATAYPQRVHRMVLDSVVRPSGVWYANNLAQNVAFEKRIQSFFDWIARNHRVYGLGRTRHEVERAYYTVRGSLADRPINGRVGPDELDDIFLTDGYSTNQWSAHAKGLSDYVVRKDPKTLGELWVPPTKLAQNGYTMYLATECRDAAWPRDWSTWSADAHRLYKAGNRFETWSNTWYNAPCAYWRTTAGPPPRVGGVAGLPGILLVQASEDAATPYGGALETHGLFPSSRLVVQQGGGNHGLSLSGDRCVDGSVLAYLRGGTLPSDRPGPDLVCAPPAPPKPTLKQVRKKRAGHVALPASAIIHGTS